jgi:hypothetical protein
MRGHLMLAACISNDTSINPDSGRFFINPRLVYKRWIISGANRRSSLNTSYNKVYLRNSDHTTENADANDLTLYVPFYTVALT